MKLYHTLIVFLLLLVSCARNNFPTKNFYETDLKELSGTYRNTDDRLLRMFELYKPRERIEMVELEFQKDSLIVSYFDNKQYQRKAFKTKQKKNTNYVDIQLKKWILPTPFYGGYNIHRLRLGKNADNELIVDSFHEKLKWVVVMMGGDSYQYQHTFPKLDSLNQELQPMQVENHWGYQKTNSDTIIAPMYNFVYPFSKGVARVWRDGKQGYINLQNEVVVPLEYNSIWHVFTDSPTAWVYKDRKWGVINIKNNETVLPLVYDEIINDGNMIWVRENWKWGLVDSLNNVLVTPQYDTKGQFKSSYHEKFNNLARVSKDGKTGYINPQGMETIPLIYNEFKFTYSYPDKGYKKYAISTLSDKYGLLAEEGVVFEPIFDVIDREMRQHKAIGHYLKVVYHGKPYLLSLDNKMLYSYKKTITGNKVDLDSGFHIDE